VRLSHPATGWLLAGTLCGALVAGRWETGTACLLISIALGALAGAKLPSGRWNAALLSSLCLGWALNLYLTPGTPLPGWPRIALRVATREGLALGALLALRLLGAAAALQGLKAAWPGEQAADAVLGALAPLGRLGLPVRETRVMLGLALRFAPMIEREGRRIAAVQALRAGRAPRGAREWLERRRAAVVPTVVSALERAEGVALALEARHYALRPAGVARPGQPALPWKLAGATLFGAALLWRRG